MRWTPGDRGNIEDRRGMSAAGAAVPMGIGGVLLLLVLSWFTGVDFLSLLGGGGSAPYTESQPTGTSGNVAASPEEERMVDFVDAVMADTQGTWGQLMQSYQPTTAVLFRSAVESTCGFAQSAVGPFYCPADRKV